MSEGLGFRELNSFNMTFLTKSYSRVLEEPTSLWVRVLKGLYFSQGDFLTTTRGSWASWGWSSLLPGRDTIRIGGVWMIENGLSVQIRKDQWINTKGGLQTNAMSGREVNEEARMSDLIGLNNQWREECVWHHVFASDLDYILRIPIPMHDEVDKLVWRHAKEGNATVQSVYHRLRETSEGGETTTQANGNRSSNLWKGI